MLELLNSKYGIYIITAGIFIGLGIILRFLFGPNGVFKDKNLTYGIDEDNHEQK